MSSHLTLANLKTVPKGLEVSSMDGLLKFVLATATASLPFFVDKQISLGVFSVFLIIITLVSGIKVRTLLLSAASYCIIVLIPYLFGVLMNSLFYTISGNEVFAHQGSYDVFLKLYNLFVIWYVSILYFHTTPIKTVIGLLDKLFTPLKLIGVPVEDYLKVVMCIVLELTETGTELKKSLGDSMRSAAGESRWKFRINVKGISQIIVALIINSFEKLDRVQDFVEKANAEELYHYKFKISKYDVIGIFGFILFALLLIILEKGPDFILF